MKKSAKQAIALKSVKGLPSQIERYVIELHNKLNALRLTVQPGNEVPAIETSSAELIKRANAILFEMLTMQQPDEVDQNEQLNVKDFYQNYLIPGLAAIKHAFEQSDNLQNYMRNSRGNDLFEFLKNKMAPGLEEQYTMEKNMQYSQICELINRIKQKLENLLKPVNDNRKND
jgi:hypothetical protein